MKVVEGRFGKKPADIPTHEFLASFAMKAQDYEQNQKKIKAVVVLYNDGDVFEVASNEQYPDGVFMLLHMSAQAILNETLGITGEIE
tara:strand:+ start:468 stop:728 length:261 start_codon:yes stop_codon:yes gene_type:complete